MTPLRDDPHHRRPLGGLPRARRPGHRLPPVILGGDITAYRLVRTFHAAYGVRPLVVNMTDGDPIGLSTLCDHVNVEGFGDADTFVGALEKVGREHARPGIPLLLVAAGDWYVRMFFEVNVRLGRSNFYVTAGGNNVSEWYVRDWVRHEELTGVEIARGEHVFAFVPKYVVRKYVLDPVLRDKALALMKAGRASDPSWYAPDLTFKRRAYNVAHHVNQVRKFRTHSVAR